MAHVGIIWDLMKQPVYKKFDHGSLAWEPVLRVELQC